MIQTIAPKPARYNGVLHRSTLEARWAAYFDAEHETIARYEPFKVGNYTPDFLVGWQMFHQMLGASSAQQLSNDASDIVRRFGADAYWERDDTMGIGGWCLPPVAVVEIKPKMPSAEHCEWMLDNVISVFGVRIPLLVFVGGFWKHEPVHRLWLTYNYRHLTRDYLNSHVYRDSYNHAATYRLDLLGA